MQEYPVDPTIRETWKSYPLRIEGPWLSVCCGAPTALVQSMTGGFVTANCSACNNRHTLSDSDFRGLGLWVACPLCRERMTPTMVEKNYAYVCVDCDRFVKLADLLPFWEDFAA